MLLGAGGGVTNSNDMVHIDRPRYRGEAFLLSQLRGDEDNLVCRNHFRRRPIFKLDISQSRVCPNT